MNNGTEQACSYVSGDGEKCCRLPIASSSYCAFHFGREHRFESEAFINNEFMQNFDSLLAKNDGNWKGFVFPRGVSFPSHFDFQINATDCIFVDAKFNNLVFNKNVDFSNSTFYGETTLSSVKLHDGASFSQCRFIGPTHFLNVEFSKGAVFNSADFSGRTVIRAVFKEIANFNQVIFREGVSFSGWRNVSVSVDSSAGYAIATAVAVVAGGHQTLYGKIRQLIIKLRGKIVSEWGYLKHNAIQNSRKAKGFYKRLLRQFAKSDPGTITFRVFEKEGQLQGVSFLKPDQTSFSSVDLSRVYFQGTNLRGIRFVGVNWWQPKLKRNGLYDELFIRYSKDGPFRHQYLPVLEETCRNARASLEDNKSFNVASDFYIAEMEAARAQQGFFVRNIFSVNALYRFSSLYGTSVSTALRVLSEFLLLHAVGSLAIDYGDIREISSTAMSDATLRSFKVLFQQNSESSVDTDQGLLQMWVDSVFRVVGLVQVAMVALAFRSRIKRH